MCRGIAAYYELGQLLAMPVLADQPKVSAVPVAAQPLPGGEFTRRLLLGPFHPTAKIDYCDPSDDD